MDSINLNPNVTQNSVRTRAELEKFIKDVTGDKSIENKMAIKNYQSDAKKELNRIVAECRRVKGNSQGEMSEEMENLRVEIGINILKQQMHQDKLKQTAEKI
jgi:hypothetical protein